MNLYWFIHTLAYGSIAALLIPLEYCKRLWLFTFLGGIVYTSVVQFIAVEVLEIWRFAPDLIDVFRVPLFFILSWTIVTLIYGYLLLRYPKYQVYIALAFVIWTGITNYAAEISDAVINLDWHLWLTIMFAVFSHVLLLFLLRLTNDAPTLGANDDLLLLE